jgi:hypothetical protein
MKYTKLDLIEALSRILGYDSVRTMQNARFSTPRLCSIAAETAFVRQIENESTQLLRIAMNDLQEYGQFDFQPV